MTGAWDTLGIQPGREVSAAQSNAGLLSPQAVEEVAEAVVASDPECVMVLILNSGVAGGIAVLPFRHRWRPWPTLQGSEGFDVA